MTRVRDEEAFRVEDEGAFRVEAEGAFRVSVDAFPLIYIEPPSATPYAYPSNTSFFRCLDQGLSLDVPFVVLHDATGLRHVNDQRGREFLSSLDQRRARIERQVLACAVLCDSPLERGIITAFIWFMRISVPVRIFGQYDAAKTWLVSQLDAHGVAPGVGTTDAVLRKATR